MHRQRLSRSSVAVLLSLCLMVLSLALKSAPVMAQIASAPTVASFADQLARPTEWTLAQLQDAQLEADIDNYLTQIGNDSAANRALIEPIVAKLDADTAPVTYVRGYTYLILTYAFDNKAERALALSDELVAYAKRMRIPDVTAEVYANRIEILQWQGKQAEAYVYVANVEVALERAVVPRVRYYANNLISRIYANWGKYEQALQHLIASLDAINETNDSRTATRRSFLYLSIAQIQTELGQNEQAMQTVVDAIAFARKNELAIDLPSLYLLKGFIETTQERFEQAEATLLEALQLANEQQAEATVLTLFNNLGDLAIRTDQLARAETYLNEAMSQARELSDEYSIQLVSFNLGWIHVKQGEFREGLAEMELALAYFREHATKSDLEAILGELAEAYGLAGLYQRQAQTLMEQRELGQSLLKLEQQRTVNELQSLYDNKDKAQQIQILEQENDLKQQLLEINEQKQLIYVLLGIVAVIGTVLMWFLYRAARRANLRLKEANLKLADQSLRDPLTGLWNRRALQEEMAKRQQQRRASDEHSADGLVLIDIDFFKRINDKHGHAAGDEVLKEISKRLQHVCRDSDKLIRWGGEEFLFYVKNVDNAGLENLCRRILAAIADTPIAYEGKQLEVTTTAGYISLPFGNVSEQEMDWERVLQVADMALYTGKAHGRNRAVGVTALQVPYAQAKDALETDLSAAVERGWIIMNTIEGP